jgi:hypothetical protein
LCFYAVSLGIRPYRICSWCIEEACCCVKSVECW